MKNIQYIVIISDEPIRPEIWESISRFPKILLINGSPLSQETLLKANIHYADKAVILGHDSTLESDSDNKADEMLDSETIFIYKAIKKWNKDLQIMTELFYSSNIEFLLPKSQINFDYKYSTLYAAGEVYVSAIIDTLTCQSYYNRHIVTILQQILKGANVPDSDLMTANPDLCQSNLWQISVPESCISKTFEQLFLYFLEKDLIWLGLYRLKATTDNDLPYVYTNPSPDTYITHKDKVFVLGIDIEQEDVPKIIPDISLQPSKVDVFLTHELFDQDAVNKNRNKRPSTIGSALNKKTYLSDEDEEETKTKSKTHEEEDDKIFGINPNKVSGSMAAVIRSLKSCDLVEKELNNLKHWLETQNKLIKKSVKELTYQYLESVKNAKNMFPDDDG